MESNSETTNMGVEAVTKDKLVNDLKSVARDAEELIKATAGDLGEKAQEARTRLAAALERAKVSYQKIQDKAVEGARATDVCIREHPYQSLGVAFGLGLLIGLLIKRK